MLYFPKFMFITISSPKYVVPDTSNISILITYLPFFGSLYNSRGLTHNYGFTSGDKVIDMSTLPI